MAIGLLTAKVKMGRYCVVASASAYYGALPYTPRGPTTPYQDPTFSPRPSPGSPPRPTDYLAGEEAMDASDVEVGAPKEVAVADEG